MSQIVANNKIDTSGIIKVDEALRIVLSHINALPSEDVVLAEALDRILAEDIYSDFDIPGFDNSAMDGYAVKSSDTLGASDSSPKTLEVIEDLKAGDIAKKILGDRQAIRIMTGASVPRGADAVVMVEKTQKFKGNGQNTESVNILEEIRKGKNIRKSDESIKKGELAIGKGSLLKSAHIGILASLGKSQIKVTRKPRVAVLATGDELVKVEEKLGPGKLHSSNTYTLCGQIKRFGGIPKDLGIAKDNPEELEGRIKEGFDCDLIITSGGVSVGDYDLVKFILEKMGMETKIWRVTMRPGKPVLFGSMKNIPIFGLPGNPVSSMVSFEVFVRPAILKMLGQKEDSIEVVNAITEEEIKKKKGFKCFVRAQTRWENGSYLTRTTGPQGSGILKSMALANSLIILPEDDEYIEKGKEVKVRFLQ